MEGELVGMGFTNLQAQKALAANNNDVQAALNWLLDHPNLQSLDTSTILKSEPTNKVEQSDAMEVDSNTSVNQTPNQSTQPSSTASGSANTDASTTNSTENVDTSQLTVHRAHCDKCREQIVGIRHKCKECKDYDLCDQCFPMRMVYHDADHEFQDHVTDIVLPEEKPLTEEQIAEARRKLDQKLVAIRKRKKEDEEARDKERELQRRKSGKEAAEAKKKWEETQLKLAADEKRREKAEEAKAKAAIREKIARQKQERAAKFNTNAPANSTTTTTTATPTATAPAAAPPSQPKVEHTTCELQVRLTDGSTIKNTFQATDTLRVVYNWVASSRTDGKFGPFNLMTAFPRKTYTSAQLDSVTLKAADLLPRGTLTIC